MLTIEYCRDGDPISDFEAEEWVREIINIEKNDSEFLSKVSTSLPIDLISLAVVDGKLNYKNVKFLFNGEHMFINEYGVIQNQKIGFCDKSLNTVTKTILAAINKRKEKRIK